MSQPPISPFPPSPLAYATPPQALQPNKLGLIGFIFVMLGLMGFCFAPLFFLGLIGTVLCGVAVFSRPRGLAIAGLIVGSIQVLVALVVIVLLGIILASGARTAAQGAQMATSARNAQTLSLEIDRYKRTNQSLPKTLADLPSLGAEQFDGVGRPIRYVPNLSAGTYQLMGDGWDEKPNTADDVTLFNTAVKTWSTTTIPTMPPARRPTPPATVPSMPEMIDTAK